MSLKFFFVLFLIFVLLFGCTNIMQNKGTPVNANSTVTSGQNTSDDFPPPPPDYSGSSGSSGNSDFPPPPPN